MCRNTDELSIRRFANYTSYTTYPELPLYSSPSPRIGSGDHDAYPPGHRPRRALAAFRQARLGRKWAENRIRGQVTQNVEVDFELSDSCTSRGVTGRSVFVEWPSGRDAGNVSAKAGNRCG